jgi:hypothetical protein
MTESLRILVLQDGWRKRNGMGAKPIVIVVGLLFGMTV